MDVPRPIVRGTEYPPDCFLQDREASPLEDRLTPGRIGAGFPPEETTVVPDESHSAMELDVFAQQMKNPSQMAKAISQDLNKILTLQKNRPSAPLPEPGIKVKPKDKVMIKGEILQQWFADLAGTASFQKLSGMLPYFSAGRVEALDRLYQVRVPMSRAAWFIRENIRHAILVTSEAKGPSRARGAKLDPVSSSLNEWTTDLGAVVKECLVDGEAHGGAASPLEGSSQRKLAYVLQLARTMFENGLLDRAEWLGWIAKSIDKMVRHRDLLVELAADYVWDFALHRQHLVALFATLCKLLHGDLVRGHSDGARGSAAPLSSGTRQRVLSLICWISLECGDALSSAGFGNAEPRGRIGSLFSRLLVDFLETGGVDGAGDPSLTRAYQEAARSAGLALRVVHTRNDSLHALSRKQVAIDAASQVESLVDALGEFPMSTVHAALATLKPPDDPRATWRTLVQWAVDGGPPQHCVARALVATYHMLNLLGSFRTSERSGKRSAWSAVHEELIAFGCDMNSTEDSSRKSVIHIVYGEFFRAGLLSFRFLANTITTAVESRAHIATEGHHSWPTASFLRSIPLWDAENSRREWLSRATILDSVPLYDESPELTPSNQLIEYLSQRWELEKTANVTEMLPDDILKLDLVNRAHVIHWMQSVFYRLAVNGGRAFSEATATWAATEDVLGLMHQLCAAVSEWEANEDSAEIALAIFDQHIATAAFDMKLRRLLSEMTIRLSSSASAVIAQRGMSLAFCLGQLCPAMKPTTPIAEEYAKALTPKSPVPVATLGGTQRQPFQQRHEAARNCISESQAAAAVSDAMVAILGREDSSDEEDFAIICELCRRYSAAKGAVAAHLVAADRTLKVGSTVRTILASRILTMAEVFAAIILPRLKQRVDGESSFAQATADLLSEVTRVIQDSGIPHVGGEAVHASVSCILRGAAGPFADATAVMSAGFIVSTAVLCRGVESQKKRTPAIFARVRHFIVGVRGGGTMAEADKDSVRQAFEDIFRTFSVATLPSCGVATQMTLCECGDRPNLKVQDELARRILQLVTRGSHAAPIPSDCLNAFIKKSTSSMQWGIAIKERIIDLLMLFLRGKMDALWPGRKEVNNWWQFDWIDLVENGVAERAPSEPRSTEYFRWEHDGGPVLATLLHQCLAGQNVALNIRIIDSLHDMLSNVSAVLNGGSMGEFDSKMWGAVFAAAHLRTSLLVAVLPTVKPSEKTFRFAPLLLALATSASELVVDGGTRMLRDELITRLIDGLFLLHTSDGIATSVAAHPDIEACLRRMNRALRVRCDRALPTAVDRWHVVDLVTWRQPATLKTPVCTCAAGAGCEKNCLRRQMPMSGETTTGNTATPAKLIPLEPVHFTKGGAAAPARGSADIAGVAVDWSWFGAARRQRSKDVYLDHFHRSRILRSNDDVLASPRKKLRTASDL
eukprot:m.52788 g.52788  ORF g.52788 m.52788 type:complete len:1427 (+) comp9127_c0_seq2:110-4390(+)